MGNEVSGLRLGLRTLFCGQSINTDRNYCDFIRHFSGEYVVAAGRMKHQSRQTLALFVALEDFRLALAENRGVIIAVRAGGFAVLQGILIIHFKGNAGILADHVKLLAFLCAVAIESESAVSTA